MEFWKLQVNHAGSLEKIFLYNSWQDEGRLGAVNIFHTCPGNFTTQIKKYIFRRYV